jgi:prephenate dehydrogenase
LLCAIDRSEVLELARPFIDHAAEVGSEAAARLVAESDIVVLAAPVGAIVRDLAWALDAAGDDTLVTDTGSVKVAMAQVASRHRNGARFVGGHPMAGREVGGFEASLPDLFEATRWFIVDPAAALATSDATTRRLAPHLVDRLTELVRTVGAIPMTIDPIEHDRAMAYISYLPQLVASALYDVAARAGAVGCEGNGFRTVTRTAGGPPDMWRDIFDENRRNIAIALGEFIEPLARAKAALERGDDGALAASSILEEARAKRRDLGDLDRDAKGAS